MSAFIVSDNHINVIASYFASRVHGDGLWHGIDGVYDYLTPDNAEKVARILMAENIRSVNERYSDLPAEWKGDMGDYEFKHLPQAKVLYSVGEIAKALDCLEYQSCEGSDYEKSEAYKLLCAMRKHLLKQVADSEGADNWEIVDIKSRAVVR